MIYTLFFSRMRDLSAEESDLYVERAGALRSHAIETNPGFVSLKTYTADDGERLTIACFRDEESQRAWRLDPVHREVQELGRSVFYDRYRIVICEKVREHGWVHDDRADEASSVPAGGSDGA